MCSFGPRTDRESRPSGGYGKVEDCNKCSCANSDTAHSLGPPSEDQTTGGMWRVCSTCGHKEHG